MRPKSIVVGLLALSLAALAVVMLERRRAGLSVEETQLAGTPVTIWRAGEDATGPLVVIAHGYAGSRQMMHPIAISLARSGLVAAAFDFYGHGRHDAPMASDVTSLDGATAQLVDQTISVARAAQNLPGVTGPTSLVGHSMATDIVIRAAEQMQDIGTVVAISMYSDAVTPQAPDRLLIISGQWEGRLRGVALDRLHQIDPTAEEGETVTADSVARRAVAAPWVGHVGVLYSHRTLSETRDWIASAMAHESSGVLPVVGPWLVLLLAALVALAWPLAMLLGHAKLAEPLAGRMAFAAVATPILPALAASALVPSGALGLSTFGGLTVFFAVWGTFQLAVLWRAGKRPSSLSVPALALLLIWGLCLIAPALDRYGASFVPTGPRIGVMGLLLIGTVPFCLADALITRSAGWVAWLCARVIPLTTLFAAMLITPRLGIAFTVLPVLVLFWCVYGVAGRWVQTRSNPTTTGVALGVILAWAIAASTPMIAA